MSLGVGRATSSKAMHSHSRNSVVGRQKEETCEDSGVGVVRAGEQQQRCLKRDPRRDVAEAISPGALKARAAAAQRETDAPWRL